MIKIEFTKEGIKAMKKYLMRSTAVLAAFLVIGGLAFLLFKLAAYRTETKTPEVKKSVEQIVEDNAADLEAVNVDKAKVKTAEDVYSLIHQMANTLIIAEDNMIIGEIPVNNENISIAMVVVKENNSISEEEREVFMNVLQQWKDGDLANGVQAHNYAWKKLKGDIGRAKELRPEYKKQ
jgi:hypothetical protein